MSSSAVHPGLLRRAAILVGAVLGLAASAYAVFRLGGTVAPQPEPSGDAIRIMLAMLVIPVGTALGAALGGRLAQALAPEPPETSRAPSETGGGARGSPPA